MDRAGRDNESWSQEANGTIYSGVIGSSGMARDPLGLRMRGLQSAARSLGGVVVVGTVIRSGAGSYDCTVYVEGKEIGCTIVQPTCSSTFGYSMGSVPIEGQSVLVYMASRLAGPGYVIGVVPSGWFCTPNSSQQLQMKSLFPWDPVGAMEDGSEAFSDPLSDKKFPFKVSSTGRRPYDTLPGEYVNLNEQNVGFVGEMFSASIMGGGSYVRVSRIDDMIRLRSTNLTIWTDFEVRRTFDDGGRISSESLECSYHNERNGVPDEISRLVSGGSNPRDPDNPQAIPRMMRYGGFLGGVESKFVQRPTISPDSDEGVFSSHISESGKMSVRAGGGVAIERYDSIPVVTRAKMPWDPEGDHPEDIEFKPKTPFKYDEDQHTHPMDLYDALAWDRRNDYLRFDEHKKDFETQQEGYIPSDSDGTPEESKADYEANKGRRAGVFINDDGSVVIRDAFGDEIVMNGGCIQISTPGSVTVMAHKSFSAWAGEAASVKALKSAELAAEGQHSVASVRGHNTFVMGGDDESKTGGVIIESVSNSNSSMTEGEPTTDSVNGVMILAVESDVVLGAKRISDRAEESISLYSGRKDGSGKIVAVADTVGVAGGQEVYLTTSGSKISLGKSDVQTVSSGSILSVATGGNTLIANGSKTPAVEWASTGFNASGMKSGVRTKYKSMAKREDGSTYTFEAIDDLFASSPTSEELGTNEGVEGFDPNDKFTIYQPFWHVWKTHAGELVPESPTKWYSSKLKFNDSMAFPGAESVDDGEYVVKEDYANLLSGDVYSIDREEVTDESSGIETKGLSELEI